MNILEYENYQEKKHHVSDIFPYVTFPCSIPLDFSSVPTHWHEEMEIIYIRNGRGIVTVDLTDYPVSEGSIIFIAPGQVHSIEQYENDSMQYINIIFKLDMLQSKQSDICSNVYFQPLSEGILRIPTHYAPGMEHYEEIAHCIDAADQVCRTNPPAYQFVIKGQLYLLFSILFSNCQEKRVVKKDQKSVEKMKLVIKYIENNYMNKITIEDMAKELHISESHFMKFFKNTMGTTFTEYLNDYRLTMAGRLLLSSGDSILNIAAEVGFDNLSYFNRQFKKHYYVTPREYRKRFVH